MKIVRIKIRKVKLEKRRRKTDNRHIWIQQQFNKLSFFTVSEIYYYFTVYYFCQNKNKKSWEKSNNKNENNFIFPCIYKNRQMVCWNKFYKHWELLYYMKERTGCQIICMKNSFFSSYLKKEKMYTTC